MVDRAHLKLNAEKGKKYAGNSVLTAASILTSPIPMAPSVSRYLSLSSIRPLSVAGPQACRKCIVCIIVCVLNYAVRGRRQILAGILRVANDEPLAIKVGDPSIL